MKYVLYVLLLSTVPSFSGYSQDTVQVKTGWNIIGSMNSGAVPDVLSTIPESLITTSFFGYAPGAGYTSTDTLGRDLGYWVRENRYAMGWYADTVIPNKTQSACCFPACAIGRIIHI
jgi:hypothetical protein